MNRMGRTNSAFTQPGRDTPPKAAGTHVPTAPHCSRQAHHLESVRAMYNIYIYV